MGVAVAALPLVLKLSISGLCRGAAGQDGEKAQKTSCKTNENKHKADHLQRERDPECCRGQQKKMGVHKCSAVGGSMWNSAKVIIKYNIFWQK